MLFCVAKVIVAGGEVQEEDVPQEEHAVFGGSIEQWFFYSAEFFEQ